MFFVNSGFEMLPDTTGAPNDLVGTIPYGLLLCLFYTFVVELIRHPILMSE